jgi:ATP phosphoribosyltransferase regulatory subunit
VELLAATHQTPLPLVLDLSLIQTFDYYTGIVFEAVSITDDRAHILAQGGRYDRLLALYHPQGQNCPGIGFSLNIEDLQQVLQTNASMPHQTPKADWLVVATTATVAASALIYAQKLRSNPESGRVEMYLNDGDIEQIRQIAIDRGVAQVAWISDDGVKIEQMD